MNKTILLVAIAIIATQSLQAQIKRQYKDDKHAQETVVVKNEKSISDLDILNSQFDIDEIGVGEVIRITTETDPKKVTLPEQPANQNTMAMVPKPVQKKVAVPKKVVPVKPVKVETTPAPKAKERYRGIYPKKSKIIRANPRFKKKKRKRVKRNKNKCYHF